MEILKINDIKFSRDSVVDQFGRIFFYQDKIYRLINNDIILNCKEFLNSSLFSKLVNLGYIVKTNIVTTFKIEGYELILEHQKILDTKPNEWSFLMYKDAVLLIYNINKISNEYGYELKDAHPHNILFDGNRPIFIDIGSFQKITNKDYWTANHEFINTMILPLRLWSKGEYYFLRLLLENDFYNKRLLPLQSIESVKYIKNILEEEEEFVIYKKNIINLITTSKIISFFFRLINLIIRKIINKKEYNFFNIKRRYKLIKDISHINKIYKKEMDSSWENYHSEYFTPDGINSTPRFDRIMLLVKELCSDSQTAIDLAGNQGIFTFLLEKMEFFDLIILSDYDENAIDKAYSYIKKNKSKVKTLLLNWMLPINLTSIAKRVKSDIVFALGITHHLILSQTFSISVIFERLNMYSKKYVVVEFMPLGLWNGITAPEIPSWYTQEWFKLNFEYFFELLHTEQLEPNRIIFLGKKRLD